MPSLSQLVEPTRTALVIVDVQNDFCAPEGVAGKAGKPLGACNAMLPKLQALIDGARAAGTQVIFIQTIHTKWTDSKTWLFRNGDKPHDEICRENTWGAQFWGIAPRPDEPVVVKHRYSAFINTRLDSVLRTLRVENLIMTGVATNVCVESTARDGFMLDYNVVFVGDCSAAYSQAAHDATLATMGTNFGRVANHDEILQSWSADRAAEPVRARA
jgi:ureidoacrylate peracid hydrolase